MHHIVDLPVSFAVQNEDRSGRRCDSEGMTYPVRGDIVPTGALLQTPQRAITLVLHGLSSDQLSWAFQHSGYDCADKLASSGRASVIVGGLGCGARGSPTA